MGNFRGRKLSRNGENTIFTEKTFADCSLCHTKGHHAPNYTEKTFAYSHKTVKFAKFSPSKVFRCTVYGPSLRQPKESRVNSPCMLNIPAFQLVLPSHAATSTFCDYPGFNSGLGTFCPHTLYHELDYSQLCSG